MLWLKLRNNMSRPFGKAVRLPWDSVSICGPPRGWLGCGQLAVAQLREPSGYVQILVHKQQFQTD